MKEQKFWEAFADMVESVQNGEMSEAQAWRTVQQAWEEAAEEAAEAAEREDAWARKAREFDNR